MRAKETSFAVDVLLSVRRDGAGTLGGQLEDQLRRAIRGGTLKRGTRLPSTRDLARQLGVSRNIVVDAYAQVAAEGYLKLEPNARPRVSDAVARIAQPRVDEPPRSLQPRFDFRPSRPDVSTFPRGTWLRSLRRALATMTDADFALSDPRGVDVLRGELADYLGRVRGVVAEPARVLVTCGYSQGLGLFCHALKARGAKRIAFEDPSNPEQWEIAARAGLEAVAIAVDGEGIRVDLLDRSGADAVAVTPAHQDPTGVVLSSERRTALAGWLRAKRAFAIEDDYDAEYRYDRAAVGALQGLAPDHVVYAGSASKILAPALRLGWLVVPPTLVAGVSHEKSLTDRSTAHVEQFAFADLVQRGELDRYLRRMRISYRARRDVMIEALADELPAATITGIAAGLHINVHLPGAVDEAALLAECERRRIVFSTFAREYRSPIRGVILMLGYAQAHESAIAAGIHELATAVRTVGGMRGRRSRRRITTARTGSPSGTGPTRARR